MRFHNNFKPKGCSMGNLNLLPHISFFYTDKFVFVNIGWLFFNVTIDIK